MKQLLVSSFGITPKETNGFLVISFVIIVFLFAPTVFEKFYPFGVISSETDKRLLDSLVLVLENNRAAQIAETAERKSTTQFAKKKPSSIKGKLFNFNPNAISAEAWQTLGVSAFMAKRIINYRNKGGTFRYKSDLLKIYDFPEAVYQNLEAYIQLPTKEDFVEKERLNNVTRESNNYATDTLVAAKKSRWYTKPEIQPFELNQATQEELTQISGIGEKLSVRIISFRDKLGGFYNEAQVRATYGLDSTICNKLLEVASIDKTKIQKIRINQVTEDELKAHPYISYNLAKVMVKYREQHGNYQHEDDLKKIRILKTETLDMLLPYISFE